MTIEMEANILTGLHSSSSLSSLGNGNNNNNSFFKKKKKEEEVEQKVGRDRDDESHRHSALDATLLFHTSSSCSIQSQIIEQQQPKPHNLKKRERERYIFIYIHR
jgi:hypothetical protein